MAARSRSTDLAIYVIVRLVVCVVQALSWPMALGLAKGLAALARRLDKRHRRVAEENLRFAFPEKSAAEIDRLVVACYEHMFTALVEMMKLPRALNRRTFDKHVEFQSAEELELYCSRGRADRPMLVLTGHFGNWEALNHVLGLMGFHAGVVARQIDNPYLERFVKKMRQQTGQQILDKNRDYQRMLEIMAAKGKLGLVGDQNAGPRGMFVPFLNRPASTYKSIALLSLEYSAPIMVLGFARVASPMRYLLIAEDWILPEEYANRPDAVRAITERYSAALEAMVRRYPEQYFWVHRRWKDQPKTALKQAA